MAHSHAGNECDFHKHVVLEELIRQICQLPAAQHIRYIDPFCGEGLYRVSRRFEPLDVSLKVAIWRNQQSVDGNYKGSPLIALNILGSADKEFSLRLSDDDDKAVDRLRQVMHGMALYSKHAVAPAKLEILKERYIGTNLQDMLYCSENCVNIVLLDPTFQDGYLEIISKSLLVCANSQANSVLCCWGLKHWDYPHQLVCRADVASCEYLGKRYCSVVYICCFGKLKADLDAASRKATEGW